MASHDSDKCGRNYYPIETENLLATGWNHCVEQENRSAGDDEPYHDVHREPKKVSNHLKNSAHPEQIITGKQGVARGIFDFRFWIDGAGGIFNREMREKRERSKGQNCGSENFTEGREGNEESNRDQEIHELHEKGLGQGVKHHFMRATVFVVPNCVSPTIPVSFINRNLVRHTLPSGHNR